MGWLDENGLVYLWNKIKTALSGKVDKVSGKGLSTNDYTSAEKTKLAGIATGANKYTHPAYTAKTSGLYKVTVDGTGHVSGTAAVTKADITGLGIPAQDTTYGLATEAANGLMSRVDKIAVNAACENGFIYNINTIRNNEKFYISVEGREIYNGSLEGTIKMIEIPNTTTSANGLMSASDKSKLDALPTNSALASTYAKKSDITNMYRFRGSVTDASKLPATGQTAGDVYNIEAASTYGPAGQNVAWTGSAWDNLGGIFTLTAITNAQIDSICV